MPKKKQFSSFDKDWEWIDLGDWSYIPSYIDKHWNWIDFGSWSVSSALHNPTGLLKKKLIKRTQKTKTICLKRHIG